ncbi:MAG TPA: pepsin-like aspartyl protease, partial [Thermoanaerobaculia bacterium]|nr:pepsin-like aspartyl protease [Thermoanaerobaculia bacterium]
YGGGRFKYEKSSTFSWIDQKQIQVDFGPWGSMMVETGRDVVGVLPGGSPSLPLSMFLSASYSGSQFRQLEWDGGLGIPSGTDYADPRVSFFVADLMNAGLMDPELPYISFQSDASTGQGSVLLGGIDQDAVDPRSAVFLPWTPYTALAGVKYIWSTPLYLYLVGETPVARRVQFCLDSGSSQFKGDDNIMNTTLSLVGQSPQPDVTMFMGITLDGGSARIVVPPSVYMVTIEDGPQKGQTLPQFNPLGLTDLVLVGSVMLDQFYTVYEYAVTETEHGYHLAPVGMWIFNRKDGPQLIQTRSDTPFEPRRRAPHAI